MNTKERSWNSFWAPAVVSQKIWYQVENSEPKKEVSCERSRNVSVKKPEARRKFLKITSQRIVPIDRKGIARRAVLIA